MNELDLMPYTSGMLAQAPVPQYVVVDSRTGQIMGQYSTLKRAHHAADKFDLHYGAYRYVVRPIRPMGG